MCSPGKHATGSGLCQNCSLGQYQPLKAASSCSTCDRGRTTVSTGSTNCTACPAGQHSQSSLLVSCPTCTASTEMLGQYRDTSTISNGRPVYSNPAGGPSYLYFVGGYWEIDFQYGVDAGQFYAADNAATPDLITSTWHAYEDGGWVGKPSMTVSVDHTGSSGLCTPCSAARFQPATASLACDQCPSGYTTSDEGSVSPDNCTACAAGKHYKNSTKACQDCSLGQYQPSPASPACIYCPPAAPVTLQPGASTPSDCKPININPGSWTALRAAILGSGAANLTLHLPGKHFNSNYDQEIGV